MKKVLAGFLLSAALAGCGPKHASFVKVDNVALGRATTPPTDVTVRIASVGWRVAFATPCSVNAPWKRLRIVRYPSERSLKGRSGSTGTSSAVRSEIWS